MMNKIIAAAVVALFAMLLSACASQSGIKWPDQNMPDLGSLPSGVKQTAFAQDLNSWMQSQGYQALGSADAERLFYEDNYCYMTSDKGSELTSEQRMQRVRDDIGRALGKDYEDTEARTYIDTLSSGVMTYAVKYNCPEMSGDVLKVIEETGGEVQEVEMKESPVALPATAENADQLFNDAFQANLYGQGLRLAFPQDITMLRDSAKSACAILRNGFSLDTAVMETKSSVGIYLNFRRPSFSDTQSELGAFVHATVATGIRYFCPEYSAQINNINVR